MDKSEKKNLLRDLVWLSIKEYIAKQPPTYWGLNYDGLPIEKEYTIDDFANDFKVKKPAIYRWKKSGAIPARIRVRLIKEGVLPKDWEMLNDTSV